MPTTAEQIATLQARKATIMEKMADLDGLIDGGEDGTSWNVTGMKRAYIDELKEIDRQISLLRVGSSSVLWLGTEEQESDTP